MNILILTNTLNEKSGWGRYSLGVINELTKNKNFNLKVLTRDKTGDDCFLSKEMNLINSVRAILKLRKAIRECDIIHSFDGYPFSVLAYLAGLGLKNKKYFINGVGTYSVLPLLNKYKAIFLKLAYKKADRIFCISNYVRNRILKYVPELKNVETVFLGHTKPTQKIYKPLKKLDKDKLNIISVGAVKPRKGQFYSVQAINLLKKEIPKIHLKIIGSLDNEEYFQKIKNFVQKNNLTSNVSFAGTISDRELLNAYQNSDIFLMPSITQGENFEGFGLVYIEAAYFGLPSIGCLETGAEDAILNNKTGRLVKQKSAEQITKALKDIINNYEYMSNQAHKWSYNFDWTKTVRQYIKYYEFRG